MFGKTAIGHVPLTTRLLPHLQTHVAPKPLRSLLDPLQEGEDGGGRGEEEGRGGGRGGREREGGGRGEEEGRGERRKGEGGGRRGEGRRGRGEELLVSEG